MVSLDEHGRPVVHTEPPEEDNNERERWVIVLDFSGLPECLMQEFEIRNAHLSGTSYVRPGRAVPAAEFFTAELANEVRRKLYKYLQSDAEVPKR